MPKLILKSERFISGTLPTKAILLAALCFLAGHAMSQQSDSSKSQLDFSGTINANSNGFSLVPTFSLGEPAVQAGFNIRGKSRISIHPQIWYSMLDYKPWSIFFIWRYKLIDREKFNFHIGTHAPAINFRSASVMEDTIRKDVIKARRFYPVLEILSDYQLKENINLGIYGILGKGIEEEVSTTNTFLSIRANFNDLPLSRQLYFRFNPQLYYLRIDTDQGFYAAGGLTLAHRKWPFSISTMMNKALVSGIDVSDFEWNVGLTYAFGKHFVER